MPAGSTPTSLGISRDLGQQGRSPPRQDVAVLGGDLKLARDAFLAKPADVAVHAPGAAGDALPTTSAMAKDIHDQCVRGRFSTRNSQDRGNAPRLPLAAGAGKPLSTSDARARTPGSR